MSQMPESPWLMIAAARLVCCVCWCQRAQNRGCDTLRGCVADVLLGCFCQRAQSRGCDTRRGCVADVVPGLSPGKVYPCGRNIRAVARVIQQVKVICAHLVPRREGEKLVLHAKVQ